MMILDCVELPYPPSVNHYWEACAYKKLGKLVRGRRKSEKALQFIEAMKILASRKNAVTGRVGVLLRVFFPDNRVRDLDNLLKGVLDGLVAAGVMLDDSQIHDLRVINSGEIVKGGKIQVSVWEMNE